MPLCYECGVLWEHARSEMAGSYCCSILNFLKNLQTDFHNGYINLYPQPIANKGSFLSTSSPTLVVRFLEDISSEWGVVVFSKV